MQVSIAEQLSELETLSRADLVQRWEQVFGKRPGLRTSKDLLLRSLGYRLQEQALGGLSTGTKRQLSRLENRLKEGQPLCPEPAARYKPGTRLVRLWKGEQHQVTVLEVGFEYGGEHYSNLSQIARRITGTQWSGPVFFGLRKPKSRGAA